VTWKSLTLDDFEGQYYNRNCKFIGCSASFLATAGFFYFCRFEHIFSFQQQFLLRLQQYIRKWLCFCMLDTTYVCHWTPTTNPVIPRDWRTSSRRPACSIYSRLVVRKVDDNVLKLRLRVWSSNEGWMTNVLPV